MRALGQPPPALPSRQSVPGGAGRSPTLPKRVFLTKSSSNPSTSSGVSPRSVSYEEEVTLEEVSPDTLEELKPASPLPLQQQQEQQEHITPRPKGRSNASNRSQSIYGVDGTATINVHLNEAYPTSVTINPLDTVVKVLALLEKEGAVGPNQHLCLHEPLYVTQRTGPAERVLSEDEMPLAVVDRLIEQGFDADDMTFFLRLDNDDDDGDEDIARMSMMEPSVTSTPMSTTELTRPGFQGTPKAKSMKLPTRPDQTKNTLIARRANASAVDQMDVTLTDNLLTKLTLSNLPIYGAHYSRKGGRHLNFDDSVVKESYSQMDLLKKDSFVCLRCEEPLHRPVVSLCGHVVCEDCILQKKKPIKYCPTCLMRVKPNQYRPCYYLQHMLQQLREHNPDNPQHMARFRAQFPYSAAHEDQVSFVEGQIFEAEDTQDDWLWALSEHGEKGLIPSNFFEKLVVEDYKTFSDSHSRQAQEKSQDLATTARTRAENAHYMRAMQVLSVIRRGVNRSCDRGEFVAYFAQHDFYPDATPSKMKEKKHEVCSKIHEIVLAKLHVLDYQFQTIDHDPHTMTKYKKFDPHNIRYVVRWSSVAIDDKDKKK